jgi:hypothetical protein
MRSSLKKITAVVLLVSLTTPAYAATPQAPQEPTIAPLNANEPAPWPGVLLNAPAVASLKFDYDHEKEKIDVIVQKAVNDVLIKKNGELDKNKATCDSLLTQKDALLEEKEGNINLLKDENRALREEVANAPSRTTWFTLGAASGIVFTVLTAFAIGQVAK